MICIDVRKNSSPLADETQQKIPSLMLGDHVILFIKFLDPNVMERDLVQERSESRCISLHCSMKKWMFLKERIFVCLIPVVLQYLQECIAKKKAQTKADPLPCLAKLNRWHRMESTIVYESFLGWVKVLVGSEPAL